MTCNSCGQPIGASKSHETCHLKFDEPKTYEEYLTESEMRYKRIIYKYGAPAIARPPVQEHELKLELLLNCEANI